jgi:adenylate cyclase
MSVESIISEIRNDVADVINTQFSYTNTTDVPQPGDPNLSYVRGKQKNGKILETCVLYVDIRNSVALNDIHKPITMGKIYTAFTKAVIKAGREHGGKTRNIIGDRVMIVFPKANCFQNAVKCAISINHIAKLILNTKFTDVDFKCGIGIDYGTLKVLKVGIQRNGTEGPVNKGLVWAGYPANIASRLTDMGHKTVVEEYYEVLRNPINPKAVQRPSIGSPFIRRSTGLLGALAATPAVGLIKNDYDPKAPLYLEATETVEMTESEFAKSFHPYKSGKGYFTGGGRMITFERKSRSTCYPPILITEAVYKGLRAEVPTADYAIKFWTEQTRKIKDVNGKVYGADISWEISVK